MVLNATFNNCLAIELNVTWPLVCDIRHLHILPLVIQDNPVRGDYLTVMCLRVGNFMLPNLIIRKLKTKNTTLLEQFQKSNQKVPRNKGKTGNTNTHTRTLTLLAWWKHFNKKKLRGRWLCWRDGSTSIRKSGGVKLLIFTSKIKNNLIEVWS